jgi:hypothetical protein
MRPSARCGSGLCAYRRMCTAAFGRGVLSPLDGLGRTSAVRRGPHKASRTDHAPAPTRQVHLCGLRRGRVPGRDGRCADGAAEPTAAARPGATAPVPVGTGDRRRRGRWRRDAARRLTGRPTPAAAVGAGGSSCGTGAARSPVAARATSPHPRVRAILVPPPPAADRLAPRGASRPRATRAPEVERRAIPRLGSPATRARPAALPVHAEPAVGLHPRAARRPWRRRRVRL